MSRCAPWLALILLAAGCVSNQATSPRTNASGIAPRNATGQTTLLRPSAHEGGGVATAPVQWTSSHVAVPEQPAAGQTSAPQYPTLKLDTDGPLARMLKPSNDRDWSPDQAVLPYAEFHGNLVHVRNIRNSTYRTVDDYTVHHYDKTFDLTKLTSVDFIVVPFDDNPAIAHVMLSFGFDNRDYLVSSVEIRKQKGQSFSSVAGFFNQYTLMYVLADERDIFWKNSIGWLSEVYLYRTKATPAQGRELFVDVMRRVNKLVREPEFYNTVTNNCTTNVRQHINRLAPNRVPYDYRVLLPGYSDQLAYDLGLLDTSRSFEETRSRARVNYLAYLYRDDPELSRKIRQQGPTLEPVTYAPAGASLR